MTFKSTKTDRYLAAIEGYTLRVCARYPENGGDGNKHKLNRMMQKLFAEHREIMVGHYKVA